MKQVAVIFGSRSAEHDVSIITAISAVLKPLLLSQDYQALPVYIAKNGKWYAGPEFGRIATYQQKAFDQWLEDQTPISLELGNGLTLIKKSKFSTKTFKIDLVFPATHGTFGEDGALMGLLDMAGVPYVGCGQQASANAMDKVAAKKMVSLSGLPIVPYVEFSAAEVRQDVATCAQKVLENSDLKKAGYPYFVKPAHLGSSIGISRVQSEQELCNALEVAAHYDSKGLVEFAVPNLIEVTVPVMGNSQGLGKDAPRVAMVEQPLTKSEDFFDFSTKYLGQGGKKGGAKSGKGDGTRGAQGYSKIPADLSPDMYKAAESLALGVYHALGCNGTARVDLLINGKTKQLYFNEVNPLPGSLYAHNWRAAGVSGLDLVHELLRLAEAQAAESSRYSTSFSSSFLKRF